MSEKRSYPQAKEVVATSIGPIMVDKDGMTYALVKANGAPAWTPIPIALPSALVEIGNEN